MLRFQEEAKAFGAEKEAAAAQARQIAAMQLICGIDLAAALKGDDATQIHLIRRIERMLERERLKGMRQHWSYDLNRHIALKQVLDRLRDLQPAQAPNKCRWLAANKNGARRRRGFCVYNGRKG